MTARYQVGSGSIDDPLHVWTFRYTCGHIRFAPPVVDQTWTVDAGTIVVSMVCFDCAFAAHTARMEGNRA